MNKELRCPYGIPENECCQASGCPTWIARQQKDAKSDLHFCGVNM